MSPESESQGPTGGGQAPTPDVLQPSGESPAQRPAPERTSGRLPEARTPGLSPLGVVCCFVAVASAAAFVACGLWQVGAIVSRAQEAVHEVVVPPAAAPVSPKPRVQPALAAADPVLTAAGGLSKAGEADAFEAQAEASERVVPVGLDAALDGGSGALVVGQPPPPDYPRVGCDDVFVYIVTVAEGAPEQSAASLAIGKKSPARFRRPGERIGEWTVLAISDDWLDPNPDVWLEKDGAACRAELAGNASRVYPAPKPKPPRPKGRRRRRR
jgi:hypothetical protein